MSDTQRLRAHGIVGYHPEGRPADDFYPTPAPCTEALLSVESFGPVVWEPACGDGAICKVLKAHDYLAFSTDLNDHGYGVAGVDFLQTTELAAPDIITNPPFILAERFLRHAVQELGCRKLALLVKLAFLEGVARSQLLEETGLARVWVFRRRQNINRVDYTGGNRGMIAYAWLIWERGYTGKPELGWI